MIDALQIWKDTLEALPPSADPAWSLNFAQWYGDRILGKITTDATVTPTGFTFPFPVPIFAAALSALPPTADALAGIQGFADAWETAILATVPSCAPGTFVGSPAPPTLFSIVASTVIDPASIAAGKAKIIELVTAPPVASAQDSLFPVKFRDATLLLTITITGTNSQPPPTGPLPLVAPLTPLV